MHGSGNDGLGKSTMEPVVLRGAIPEGYGSGDGSGYGSGYGYGYGYGSGYGDGYGSGDGDGSGYGYGDGDGYGDGYYWAATIEWFATKWTDAQRLRLSQLRSLGATVAFWRSRKDGRAANGGKNPVTRDVGTVETISGPLTICTENALHATLVPPKWKGDRWWIVALTGEVVGDEEKYGALSREIIGECL
jgi:hypothetical protein